MRATPTVSRILSQSGNLLNGDVANAKAFALGNGLLQLSARVHAAGVCYAFFSRIDCSAELP